MGLGGGGGGRGCECNALVDLSVQGLSRLEHSIQWLTGSILTSLNRSGTASRMHLSLSV